MDESTYGAAILALFGDSPPTALPDRLLTWAPTPALVGFLTEQDVSLDLLVSTGLTEFSRDQRYFDEVIDSAIESRSSRQRQASMRRVQEAKRHVDVA